MKTNFLILGSGIAGLSTALTLAEKFPAAEILVATKSSATAGSTRYAQGGIAAVRDFEWDSFDEHARDTFVAGAKTGDKKAIRLLVERAPAAVEWLEILGVKFEREPTREAAHSHSRIWHTKDSTGESIEKVLLAKTRAKKNIKLLTNTSLLDFLVEKNVCRGAIVRRRGEIFAITAGQTFLATGGFGQLFARTTNPTVSVGDGLAAAIRANAKTQDLEFVQFHPTALVGKSRRLTLLSESLRGEGAMLRNSRGERFMPAYDPAGELAPRDVVARAIWQEMKTGRVFLDFTRADKKFLRSRFPLIFAEVAKAGFDLSRDLIPVFPVAHYSCGGVATDLDGKTSVRNLFAVGEAAATGVHGANRLASNSLSEAVVFGRAAGEAAKILEIEEPSKKPPPYFFDAAEDRKILKIIREKMWEEVGIVRTPAGLADAIAVFEQLKPKSFTAKNAREAAIASASAAALRKKSVGTHFLERS